MATSTKTAEVVKLTGFRPIDGTDSAKALAKFMNDRAAFKKENERGDNYNDSVKGFTRSNQMLLAGYWREHPKGDVDTLIAWEKGGTLPSGRSLVSRRTEMNALKSAAVNVTQARLEAVYGDKVNKEKFISICRLLGSEPKASDDRIAAYLADKDESRKPSAETFGGHMVALMAAATAAYRASPKDFARYQKWLGPMQQQFLQERQAGKLPTAKEQYATRKTETGVDFTTAKAS